MDDVYRKRLSEEELTQYDRCDRRASIAGHFFVWPMIAGLVSYSYGRYPSALICLSLVVVAFPFMVVMGKRARKLRELAEARYIGSVAPASDESKST